MTETRTLETPYDEVGVPEIERLDYDLWELRITVRFNPHEPPIYVTFSSPAGFRVLDEGSLNEFWTADSRSAGWVWQVTTGGWLDQECQRPGFVRAATPGSEFLVLGQNDCVSVISLSPPSITQPEPHGR